MWSSTLHIFARGDVDGDIAPFFGGNVGESPLEQGFACGDDLDDAGVTFGKVTVDRRDQRRGLHGGNQMIEEALLGALKGRPRRGLGLSVQRLGSAIRPGTSDVGGFKRGRQIVVNDLLSRGSGNAEERGVTGEFP